MTLSAKLWTLNADLAEEALEHPFVGSIADGTLAREVFCAYVAQDGFFLEAFSRAYALGIAHSSDRASLEILVDLLTGARDELRLHDSYAAQWGINMAAVEPLPTTLSYTDFLLATASLGSVSQLCAAMAPCMRLYAYIGQQLAEEVRGDYAEWVRTYADPSFEALAVRLECLLDRISVDSQQLRATYRRAMQLEIDFFTSVCVDA